MPIANKEFILKLYDQSLGVEQEGECRLYL